MIAYRIDTVYLCPTKHANVPYLFVPNLLLSSTCSDEMQASRICRAAVDTSQIFKRAQNGLFHGKMIQFGNNVPHSKQKTRRNWLPNIQTKHFDSELLGRERMRFKVTTRALKTIKKYGGLDNYLLGVRTKFLGEQGMRVRLLLRNELRRREDKAIFAEAVRAPRSLGWTKVSYEFDTR